MASNNKEKSLVIVGATGAVGTEIINCLIERHFPVKHLRLFGSSRSIGKTVDFKGEKIVIEELSENSFTETDIVFFAASNEISKKFVPIAKASGAISIDNSSAYRLDTNVPLIVPEVNPDALRHHQGVIANPNCSTIIAAVPLWPLYKQNKIKRLIVSTYQAASGAGVEGMDELIASTKAYLNNEPFEPTVFQHDYAFNLFSHNSPINPVSLYNEEEEKLINETRKIFADENIRISVTCIRVPVIRAHSESITVEFENEFEIANALKILSDSPGVVLVDDHIRNTFPTPRDASGQGEILVGRIRKDLSDPSGKSLSLFVAGDQILKGAALNAVQIAELLLVTEPNQSD